MLLKFWTQGDGLWGEPKSRHIALEMAEPSDTDRHKGQRVFMGGQPVNR